MASTRESDRTPLRLVAVETPERATPAPALPAAPPKELNARILNCIVRYLIEYHGRNALLDIAERSQIPLEALDGSSFWLSAKQVNNFMEAARSAMTDDEEFLRACSFKLRESYGPAQVMLRATSVRLFWEAIVRTMPVVSKVSRYEIVDGSRTFIIVKYLSDVPDSRLMCLSRQSQTRAQPTLWGLPQATLVEHSCLAHGDACCTYELHWHDQPRWLPSVVGTAAGFALASATAGLLALPVLPFVALPIVGLLSGYVLEMRRTNRVNLAFSEKTNAELQALGRANAEAMEEILALHQRQRQWSRHLEERVTDRTSNVQALYERLQQFGQQRETVLRTISHDLRNPLTVLKAAQEELRRLVARKDDAESEELFDDMRASVGELERLIREMVQFATESRRTQLVRLNAVRLAVEPLADRLRRRLRALVLGRSIRISVFATREAPDEITTDSLLFDRVIDNLLTNAAKYTQSGSVVVELTGRPGLLTVKVSDTGPGIGADEIEWVFKAHDSGRGSPLEGSYGLGLSIVVRLLDQVGGKLEVMSKPHVGTTFWAHFPIDLPDTADVRAERDESLDDIIDRVVTIRRVVT